MCLFLEWLSIPQASSPFCRQWPLNYAELYGQMLLKYLKFYKLWAVVLLYYKIWLIVLMQYVGERINCVLTCSVGKDTK